MTLWRISKYTDLSGVGGLRVSGRWHVRGTPVVYLSDHPATCLLEMLVQVGRTDLLPREYQWLEVDAGDVPVADIGTLPDGWAHDVAGTRARGRAWLDGRSGAMLRVPSVVAPSAWNLLCNPHHPDASGLRIVAVHHWPLDPRLQGMPPELRLIP